MREKNMRSAWKGREGLSCVWRRSPTTCKKTVQRRMEITQSGGMAFRPCGKWRCALSPSASGAALWRYRPHNVLFPEGASLAELQGLYGAAFPFPEDVEGNPLLQKQTGTLLLSLKRKQAKENL